MRALPFVLGLFLLLGACDFDSSALRDLESCTEDADCPSGSCVGNRCLPTLTEPDPIEDTLEPDDTTLVPPGDVDDAFQPDDTTVDTRPPDRDIDEVCTPNIAECVDSNTLEVCDAEGGSAEAVDCEDACDTPPCVCRDDECLGQLCEPDALRCAGAVLERCNDGVRWSAIANCQSALGVPCLPGDDEDEDEEDVEAPRCDNPEATCDPGSLRCAADGARVEICLERVGYVAHIACGSRERCDDGACLAAVCEPGTATCESDTTRAVCEDGTGIAVVPCINDTFCNREDGQAVCAETRCTPDTLFCDDERTLMRCDESGQTATVEETCAAQSVCRDDRCLDRLCQPGTFRCTDEGRETCGPQGLSWQPAPCDDGFRCDEGVCVPQACEPESIFCGEGRARQQCRVDGSGADTLETCEGLCNDGVCEAPFCGDGVVTPSAGETCDDGNDTICDGCESCQRLRNLRLTATSRTTEFAVWTPERARFTMEAWLRSDTPSGLVFGIGDPDSNNHLLVAFANGKLEVRLAATEGNNNDTWSIASPDDVTGTGWRHVTVSRFNDNGLSLHLDGELVAWRSGNSNGRSIQGNGRIWIGAYREGTTPNGALLGALHLYQEVPAGTSIRPARTLTARGDTLGLWTFNEASGNRINDTSGAGRHLTVTGAQRVADACYEVAGPSCGDGVVAPWEDCDGGDGCTDQCRFAHGCNGVRADNGRCYMVSLDNRQYGGARAYCEAWGGHLATVRNRGENDFIQALSNNGNVWIGLFTTNTSNTRRNRNFQWHSGASESYRRWDSGEPNNAGLFSAEQCVEMGGNGRWNDLQCSEGRRFVCEK